MASFNWRENQSRSLISAAVIPVFYAKFWNMHIQITSWVDSTEGFVADNFAGVSATIISQWWYRIGKTASAWCSLERKHNQYRFRYLAVSPIAASRNRLSFRYLRLIISAASNLQHEPYDSIVSVCLCTNLNYINKRENILYTTDLNLNSLYTILTHEPMCHWYNQFHMSLKERWYIRNYRCFVGDIQECPIKRKMGELNRQQFTLLRSYATMRGVIRSMDSTAESICSLQNAKRWTWSEYFPWHLRLTFESKNLKNNRDCVFQI